jgi:hypothetical protein
MSDSSGTPEFGMVAICSKSRCLASEASLMTSDCDMMRFEGMMVAISEHVEVAPLSLPSFYRSPLFVAVLQLKLTVDHATTRPQVMAKSRA